jgi:hypothetical protein
MTIPFVIDNQRHRMADILNELLAAYTGHSLDIATAYFNVGGWQLLNEGLRGLGSLRLLLGDESEAGFDLGLREAGAKPVKGLIRDLAQEDFREQTLRQVEELIAFLRRENVQVRLYTKGFLHAKSYLFYSGGGFDRLSPVAAIVGSSNFTRPGLLSNKELNLTHCAHLSPEEITPERVKGLLEPEERKRLAGINDPERVTAANLPGVLAIHELSSWYEQQWESARDFKEELINLLDASKFGRKAYMPYQVYMKAIFEYFRDDLDAEESAVGTRSVVELSEFQEDAVKKARRILARCSSVMIADSVGLGKTWIGKKLLEDFAYHQRYKALIVCPASLQKMWQDELFRAGIAARIVTQESLGRDEFDTSEVLQVSLLFRSRFSNEYILGLAFMRKKAVLPPFLSTYEAFIHL